MRIELIKDLIIVSAGIHNYVDGCRMPRTKHYMEVEFRGHSGRVEIGEDLEWPEDGVEWDVCPSEWESLETDIQSWFTENCADPKYFSKTGSFAGVDEDAELTEQQAKDYIEELCR